MSVINADNRDFWRDLAENLSRQRPYVGREVRIVAGRKHKGKRGKVIRHEQSRFFNPFRYGGAAQHHMTEMAGRYGYACLIDTGTEVFWVNAEHTDCELDP